MTHKIGTKLERHGYFGTKIYKRWAEMKRRCYAKSAANYPSYGGRGITVCDRWRNSFKAFLEDMGEIPEGMTLDRIDNNGPYCKENCRWATDVQQARNTRRNVSLTVNGVTKNMKTWCSELGLKYATVKARKWTKEKTDEECLKPGNNRIHLMYEGKEYTPPEIAKKIGINVKCVYSRIKAGWPVEEIINRPNSQPYKKPGWSFKSSTQTT